MEAVEPVKRTAEIEEVTNLHLIHPIASRLVPFCARMKISPNAVSFAGMAFGVSAAIAYNHYQNASYAIVGFLCMVMWHIMDGADGQLARLTQSQSELGKVLDGICDYVTFVAVYVGLALPISAQQGRWVWGLVAVAGVCHAVQAAAYEVQRQDYNFWGLGLRSAQLPDASAPLPTARAGSGLQRQSHRVHRLYAAVQLLTVGSTVESRLKLATMLNSQPERAASIRARYRQIFAPAVRRWSVMSANYRTIGIFAFALLQRPLYYFWWEVVGLTTIMVVLLVLQHRRYALFFAKLDTAE